jgi:hypothetical protein
MKDEAWIFLGNSEVTESQLGLATDYFRARPPVVFMNMCHSAARAKREIERVLGRVAPQNYSSRRKIVAQIR